MPLASWSTAGESAHLLAGVLELSYQSSSMGAGALCCAPLRCPDARKQKRAAWSLTVRLPERARKTTRTRRRTMQRCSASSARTALARQGNNTARLLKSAQVLNGKHAAGHEEAHGTEVQVDVRARALAQGARVAVTACAARRGVARMARESSSARPREKVRMANRPARGPRRTSRTGRHTPILVAG